MVRVILEMGVTKVEFQTDTMNRAWWRINKHYNVSEIYKITIIDEVRYNDRLPER